MVQAGSRPVVGLGASAGGIEAFHEFFAAMPPQNGLVFLVVLHLAPERASLLGEILGHWTQMPVRSAQDGEQPQVEHVYVIPPDTVMTIRDGRLRLRQSMERRHVNTAIDALFASMAEDLGDRAIGIVLSGTGSDGALGLKAIKACGGVTFAQGEDGTSPGHGGMPSAAIATGAVDLVLPVQDMPARILSIIGRQAPVAARSRQDSAATSDDTLRLEICAVLRDQIGHDFSHYKEQTFMRRVRRRVGVNELDHAAYLEKLRHDRAEVMLLFRDLLIGVTGFFRDGATFQHVQDLVLPRLFAHKSSHDTIRIWVPGCATGEEVYSLAMILVEFTDTLADPPQLQIFGTDIDSAAIDIARMGRYPQVLLRDVAPGRLARFFRPLDDGYVVVKEVRTLCTFSAHSIIRDPPFSRMDLISCRNLLIYLDLELQGQVIPAFHYSLRPGGILLLGASEAIGRHGDLFSALDRKHRIYERSDAPSPPLQVSALGAAVRLNGTRLPAGKDVPGVRPDVLQLAQQRVRERFSPAYAVVDRNGEAVHFSPRTGKYLEIPSGPPSSNLVAQARPGLRAELRMALRKAVDLRQPVERENVSVESEAGTTNIVLTIEPLPQRGDERLFLVVFTDDARLHVEHRGGDETGPPYQDITIEHLEREMRDMREQNQSIAEEYETALEELKSANEELHSVNEELQSSNEELETSKEEIQSVNEELQTVNNQLTAKVEELDRASSDLRNVFDSTRVPTVFLDRDLVIRSFTPALAGIYKLIPADQGRPLSDIVTTLDYTGLRTDVDRVLETLEPVEKRVAKRDGSAHYLLRALPYRSSSNDVEGVLVTFADVTSIVAAEQHDRLLVDELNHRVKNMLTVVISLARQTRRSGGGNFGAFWDAFMGRLHALGNAYELLSRDQWTDVPLGDVLQEELKAFANSRPDDILMQGPRLYLRPRGALALGMVAHELATNSLRHGALSIPGGHVEITWSVAAEPQGEMLHWHWRERDGPPVRVPARRGFGITLIERSLKHELGGHAAIDFQPDGLDARLTIPFDPLVLSHVTSKQQAPAP